MDTSSLFIVTEPPQVLVAQIPTQNMARVVSLTNTNPISEHLTPDYAVLAFYNTACRSKSSDLLLNKYTSWII